MGITGKQAWAGPTSPAGKACRHVSSCVNIARFDDAARGASTFPTAASLATASILHRPGMKIFRGLRGRLPGNPQVATGGCALTIGNFDGVHRGHQAMLALLRSEAAHRGVPSCVMTWPSWAWHAVKPCLKQKTMWPMYLKSCVF
eukprot:gene43083-biopygen34623